MKPLEHTLPPQRQATDVAEFFIDITEAYMVLEQSVLHLIHNLSSYTPEQILAECTQLSRQRGQLEFLDRQLLSIIELAGVEIAGTHMVYDYRVAFAKAAMASNNLYQKLLAIKATL